MHIITKFTVATEQGIDTLLMLTRELAIEKFSALMEPAVLDHYINANFNERTLIGELNSLANQWLVVYVEGSPAGYARITAKGKRPEVLNGQRAIRIADFGILQKYADPLVSDTLLEKCLSVCRPYQSIWIHEYAENPFLPLFESKGFARQQEPCLPDELPLPSVCLIA